MLSFIFGVLLMISPMCVSGDNWAVLIAGSNYYFNYRHQSDICHAYQILTKSGKIPPENIVVMMYDDIAYNQQNPFQGQIFNKPNGTNVYEGVHIDYKGNAVNKTTFLKVLRGDASAGGKVLKSTANDDVFIYYADHGAVGLVAMPVGDVLYANELMDALRYMHKNQMYRQLVFYMEACESGSMFDGVLPANMSIFATTAANPDESSYAYYYWDPVNTYLGDEYSIRWMEDSDKKWKAGESLQQQFLTVKKQVKLSHPQEYGDKTFDGESIHDFEGDKKPALSTKSPLIDSGSQISVESNTNEMVDSSLAIDSRDVKLAYLMKKYESAQGITDKLYYKAAVDAEIEHRFTTTYEFKRLMGMVTGLNSMYDVDEVMKAYRPPRNFDCIKTAVTLHEKRCGKLTDFSLKFVRNIVYLCEEYPLKLVISGVSQMCQ